MTPDRRTVLGLAAAAASTPALSTPMSDPTEILRLWPQGAPGGEKVPVKLEITERSKTLDEYRDRFATGITDPILTVFRPARPDGSAVLIAPGGGYIRVVIDKEGFEAAHRLAPQDRQPTGPAPCRAIPQRSAARASCRCLASVRRRPSHQAQSHWRGPAD